MNIKDVVKVIQSAESCKSKKISKVKGKAISVDGERLTIYFTTNISSRKVSKIRANKNVCLYFCLPKKIKGISAIGIIEEVTDMSIKEDFWHTTWLMYYHKGAHNPDYTILKFRSKYLHCWGNLGIHNFGHGVNSCDKE